MFQVGTKSTCRSPWPYRYQAIPVPSELAAVPLSCGCSRGITPEAYVRRWTIDALARTEFATESRDAVLASRALGWQLSPSAPRQHPVPPLSHGAAGRPGDGGGSERRLPCLWQG